MSIKDLHVLNFEQSLVLSLHLCHHDRTVTLAARLSHCLDIVEPIEVLVPIDVRSSFDNVDGGTQKSLILV